MPNAGDYFERDRSVFLDWLGGTHRRVLEIGCGRGANATWLRSHGATHITGVEINGASASIAADRYDRIEARPIEMVLDELDGPYDLILCLDVLEHLVDPWSVLDGLRPKLAQGGILAASIPNIRFVTSLWSIAVGRGFRYEAEGIFDVTHLRFFTRADIRRMLMSTGWTPLHWGVPGRHFKLIRRTLRLLSRGRSDEWLTVQWFVTAGPTEVHGQDRVGGASRSDPRPRGWF